MRPDRVPTDVKRTCIACDASLHLLQETCQECGAAHDWSHRAACTACGRETDYLDGPCACGETHSPWRVVEAAALADGPVTVAKNRIERPTAAGYRRHVGSIRGQWADYRRVLEDGEFHVRVFLDHYQLHVDAVSALADPAQHTLRYGPAAAVTTGRTVVGGLTSVARHAGGFAEAVVRTPVTLLTDSGSGDQPERDR